MQSASTEGGRKQRANMFVLNMIIVYALWKVFAYYVSNSSGWAHDTWNNMIYSLGVAYSVLTSWILNVFGENTVPTGNAVLFPGFNKIIYVESHCLAIPATIIFIVSIISFKGDWFNKLWFIPMGVVLIILINLLRLIFLCYTFAHFSRPVFDINHSLVYVVVTYTLIFLMIAWWMRRFAGLKTK